MMICRPWKSASHLVDDGILCLKNGETRIPPTQPIKNMVAWLDFQGRGLRRSELYLEVTHGERLLTSSLDGRKIIPGLGSVVNNHGS